MLANSPTRATTAMSTIPPTTSWTPNYAVCPGTVLREHMEARGWSPDDLARQLARPVGEVCSVLAGTCPLDSGMAADLEKSLNVSAKIWSGIEASWQRCGRPRQTDPQA